MSPADAGLPSPWPLGRGVLCLAHETCGLIALDKAAGILSHPNGREDQDKALLSCRYDPEDQSYVLSGSKRLWLLNRLDSATSGVILLSETAAMAETVRGLFKAKRVEKIYSALVFGSPSVPEQLWRDRLAVERKGGVVRTRTEGNIPSECSMRLLCRKGGARVLSLLRLEPRTGRSHQLRVQCASRKLPIVGDATYGDFQANRDFAKLHGHKRLFLHSSETRLTLDLPGGRRRFCYVAPLPTAFEEVLGASLPKSKSG